MAVDIDITGMPITALDESYGHQLVAPRAATLYRHPFWQERCYHMLFGADGTMLDIGRALWPHAGVRRAFIGISDGRQQLCIRVQDPFALGQDVDEPAVGDISVEALKPLQLIALTHASSQLELSLTYTARSAPVAGTPAVIEQHGQIATHYMNFFQSGLYDGQIRFDGRTIEVRRRAGFRDRGWGVRKHEGAPARGLVLAAFCELPDQALYMLMFETASSKRVLSDGWVIDAQGARSIAEIEHELRFEGELLQGGAFGLTFEDGSSHTLRFEVSSRLFLAGVGYSPQPARQEPGVELFDLTDERTLLELRGQTDNGCTFSLDGLAGHGYVETGLGVHSRYRPDDGGASRS